jgi:hypothetical protein
LNGGVKFRRRSAAEPTAPSPEDAETAEERQAAALQAGPWDEEDLPEELHAIERADLGSLLLTPVGGREVRLQVEEETGTVAAVLIGDDEGAIERRAFAAPRNGSTWEEVLPELEADIAQRGGVSARREGTWGTELLCQVGFQTPDGQTGVQPSRIVGIDGPRWMLRATFLGRPAVEEEVFPEWEDVLRTVVVRRGKGAMPKGEALPIVLPADARRTEA